MSKQKGTVYLMPLPIGPDSGKHFETEYFKEKLKEITVWVAENARTLRRYISALKLEIDINSLEIFELDHRTPHAELEEFLDEFASAMAIGVCSEAGIPCVADPGNRVVSWAHRRNKTVEPLLGPNSLLMALAGSGLNGQQFIFHGYPPIKDDALRSWVADLNAGVYRKFTHLFIETPFRSDKTFNALCKWLPENAKLCVAADLHSENQSIKTFTINQWRKSPETFGKIPVVFVVGN